MVLLAFAAAVLAPSVTGPANGMATRSVLATDSVDVPAVLRGDTWLRHHREDLMPYWDVPEALGVPAGNFPSFRGRSGELLEESRRGLSTLARGVYGYSLAFMLTGEKRYLAYAKAGLDWIDTKAKDPVHGGYYGELDLAGEPVDKMANKDVFDLASLGLAYGMYFNVTRDPAAEAGLLSVRDLLFDKYYDAAANRVRDSLSHDLSTEVDTGGNGGDITNYLVPVTAMYLTNTALLTEPSRRLQFKNDMRLLTQALIDRHKNSAAANNRWWFWGRTLRFGGFNAAQTDFGHNIKSYEMIYNANKMFADRPWDGLAADRDILMNRAWDDPVARWNQRLRNFQLGNVEPDSAWWIHDEADQTLAALDLSTNFVHKKQLARSAQAWLDVFVDRDPAYPVRETFARVARDPADTNLTKSHFGKNMLHAHEHALIMYLHGRALERQPATLYYAFPEGVALTAVAKPYWFDASGEFRKASHDLSMLPGHQVVEVSFTGIDGVPTEPFPPPSDSAAPVTVATLSTAPNAAGWHREPVTVSLHAADDVAGVKEIHVRIEDATGNAAGVAFIDPGEEFTLPALTSDGDYEVTFHSVDRLGHSEEEKTLHVRIDQTSPSVAGLPRTPCVIWPPNQQMVHVADVVGSDALSGVAAVVVTGTSNEPNDDDIHIVGGSVALRAERDGPGTGRVYALAATVTDHAGNATTQQTDCTVPHHRSP